MSLYEWIVVRWIGTGDNAASAMYWTGDTWHADGGRARCYATRVDAERGALLEDAVPGVQVLQVPRGGFGPGTEGGRDAAL
jgi:hypothetical protein